MNSKYEPCKLPRSGKGPPCGTRVINDNNCTTPALSCTKRLKMMRCASSKDCKKGDTGFSKDPMSAPNPISPGSTKPWQGHVGIPSLQHNDFVHVYTVFGAMDVNTLWSKTDKLSADRNQQLRAGGAPTPTAVVTCRFVSTDAWRIMEARGHLKFQASYRPLTTKPLNTMYNP